MAMLTFYFVAVLAGRIGFASFFFIVQVAVTATAFSLLNAAVTIAPGVMLLILVAEAPGLLAIRVRESWFNSL